MFTYFFVLCRCLLIRYWNRRSLQHAAIEGSFFVADSDWPGRENHRGDLFDLVLYALYV
jgi:hypothetical protein